MNATPLIASLMVVLTMTTTALRAEDGPVLYHEPLRPQFHFTAAKGWINDPNGLVFYDGAYHLFFQHNPRGNEWGNMTWGHAVSPDLVHWTQLPNALEPDKFGTMFSGSAVVDSDNTVGFQKGEERTLVALYTAAGGTSDASTDEPFTQCLAFSNDRGRTWTKYAKNPVVPALPGPARNEARDPKVIWCAPIKRWVMALFEVGNTFGLFTSPDLKSWTRLQEMTIDGCSECPDFFPMPVVAEPATTKWVFTAANAKYLVGSFDGTRFAPEQELRQVDFGRNFYAVQTYSDIPATDGRRIQLGWMRDGKYPGMPFNQQMSFPRELTLRRTPDGLRLFVQPVREIELLRGKRHAWNDPTLKPGEDRSLDDVRGDSLEIMAEFAAGGAEEFGVRVRGETISYSVKSKQLTALGTAPVELDNGRLTLRILVDRTSIETFANDGRVSLTSCFLPKADATGVSLFTKGGAARVISLEVYELKSAWP